MRWQDIGLATLAVVTAVLTLLMFRAVGEPPDGGAGLGGRSTVAPAGPSEDDRTAADGPSATSATPDATGSTDQGSDPRDERPGADALRAAREVLDRDDPLVVAALGDSTGNETWEWVYGWARLLAQTRPVAVLSWNEWSEDGYIEPRVLPGSTTGGMGAVTLYSGHQSGAPVGYVAEHADDLLPEPPDLVILNFGHNDTVAGVTEGLEEALRAVRRVATDDVPVVVTLQQPQEDDANAEVRAAVRAFAVEQGLGVIDVAAAFEDSGSELEDLLADPVHPNEAGAALWTEAVARALQAP